MNRLKTKIPANVQLAGIFASKNYVSMKKHEQMYYKKSIVKKNRMLIFFKIIAYSVNK